MVYTLFICQWKIEISMKSRKNFDPEWLKFQLPLKIDELLKSKTLKYPREVQFFQKFRESRNSDHFMAMADVL